MSWAKRLADVFRERTVPEKAMDDAQDNVYTVIKNTNKYLEKDEKLLKEENGNDKVMKIAYGNILAHVFTGLGQLDEAVNDPDDGLKHSIDFVKRFAASEQWENRTQEIAIKIIENVEKMDKHARIAKDALGAEAFHMKYQGMEERQHSILKGILEEISEGDYQVVLNTFEGKTIAEKLKDIWDDIHNIEPEPMDPIVARANGQPYDVPLGFFERTMSGQGLIKKIEDLSRQEGHSEPQFSTIKDVVKPLLYAISDAENFATQLWAYNRNKGRLQPQDLEKSEVFCEEVIRDVTRGLERLESRNVALPGEYNLKNIKERARVAIIDLQEAIEVQKAKTPLAEMEERLEAFTERIRQIETCPLSKGDVLDILDEMARNHKERGEICLRAIENNAPQMLEVYDSMQKIGVMESEWIAKHIESIDASDVNEKDWSTGFCKLVKSEIAAKGKKRYVTADFAAETPEP